MAAWKKIHGFEMVVGLQVHVELKTKTKIFCSCPTDYGAPPNTQCCPICMGYPGTLPKLNRLAVHYAALAGLATGCEVHEESGQDRKNYFYPDLPKAYQISQFDQPMCEHGGICIETDAGEKTIGITRIHIEQDAGKLIHDDRYGTMIDCNRCGVPLIEIVSEPDIRSPQQADAYLKKLRAIIRYTGISDCKMNEGSLRCDVNLSVHQANTPFGTRTEIKNLNSFQSVYKAIEAEYRRQVEVIESGGRIEQETRRYDQHTGKTYTMRRKEEAQDYRFFSDPDLTGIVISAQEISEWRRQLPALPDERKAGYIKKYGITPYAAQQLVSEKNWADYFESAVKKCTAHRTLANLMIVEVFRLLDGEDDAIRIPPQKLAYIADLTQQGKINNNSAKKLIAALWEQDEDVDEYIAQHHMLQLNDAQQLKKIALKAIQAHPEMVIGYRKGKTNLKKALMGVAMGMSGGAANPTALQQIMNQLLENEEE